jgi:hypothetical protein
MPQALKFSQQSVLAAYTGPISVANCGLIFVFNIRYLNRFMVTIFWELVKDGVDPYSKIASAMLKTKRNLRGISNPHSKNICGVETKSSASRDKQPALEEYMRCQGPRGALRGTNFWDSKQKTKKILYIHSP